MLGVATVCLPKINDPEKPPNPDCKICEGFGWVCENHPNLPFDHGDGCGGAGDPCICNHLYEHKSISFHCEHCTHKITSYEPLPDSMPCPNCDRRIDLK